VRSTDGNENDADLTEISGTIIKVVSDDPVSADFYIDSDRGVVRARGYAVMPFVGVGVTAAGHIADGRVGGPQLILAYADCSLPLAPGEQIAFLTSSFRGLIDDSLAHQLVVAFGGPLYRVLDFEPQELRRVASELRCRQIEERWAAMREAFCLETHLESIGVKPTLARQTIVGLRALGITNGYELAVNANPYLLSRVHALTFSEADELALKHGFREDSPERVQARTVDDLEYLARFGGHTAYPRSELVRRVSTSIEVSRTAAEHAIDELARARDAVVDPVVDGKPFVALGEYYRAEVGMASDILRIRETCQPLYTPDDPAVKEILARASVPLSEMQRYAVFSALTQPALVITGGPGNGKTEIAKLIAIGVLRKTPRLAQAAPTGRAAKRMSMVSPAMTIERLLGLTAKGFTYNERNPLDADFLMGDEWGMVSALIGRDLFRAVRCPITLTGDVNQLASVKAGNVLADIINSGAIPVVRLNENFRTDSRSIIEASARILDGEMPEFDEQFAFHERSRDIDGVGTIARAAKKAVEVLGSFNDVQVLSAQKDGLLGTANLNAVLQMELNPPTEDKRQYRVGPKIFREGDRIMQTRNDYNRDFMNGDIGYIEALEAGRAYIRLDENNRMVEVPRSSLEDLQLAYAITIHKSQGGEYKHVLMPLSLDHRNQLNKNILYTGITRAKSRVSLVGSMEALQYSITTNAEFRRFSTLGSHLRDQHLELSYKAPEYASRFDL
jgi:exodeoxyribonuclease V alpha subunit